MAVIICVDLSNDLYFLYVGGYWIVEIFYFVIANISVVPSSHLILPHVGYALNFALNI